MEKEIFKPLGMLRTTADINKGLADSNLAIGHDFVKGHYIPTISKFIIKELKPMAPAGAIFSSVVEMSKYLQLELNGGKLNNGEQFISEYNLLYRRKPQTELNGMLGGDHYALGWITHKHKGLEHVKHPGSAQSYQSQFSFYPEKKLGMVILTNAPSGQSVYTAVEEKILELWFDSKEGADLSLKNIKFEDKVSDKSLDSFNEDEFFFNQKGFSLTSTQKALLDHLIGTYHNEYIERVQIKKIKNEYWFELESGDKIHILSANENGTHDFIVGDMPMKIMKNSFSLDGGRDEWEYVFTAVNKEKTEL